MAPRGFNREYYKAHPNPHGVDYKTFLRRVYRLHISRKRALSYPNLGRGGDRKTDNMKQIKNTISITYIISKRDTSCL